MTDLIVVGAGPAGMTAALFAARAGLTVQLLDHNEKTGKKLYITGKGRCNLTNNADFEDFLAQVPHNPRFLMSALRRFSSGDLIALMEELGVPCQVQRGGRVFPASEKASDVTRALERALRALGVEIRLGAEAAHLWMEEGQLHGILLRGGEQIAARVCLLATGGASYPATGSTGAGYALCREAGHTVHPPRPALVPLVTGEDWPRQLSGLSLKNVKLSAALGKKRLYSGQGEMLFTHFGLSGPLVLELSSYLVDLPLGQVALSLDMKPALSPDVLDARLVREFSENPRKQLSGVLAALLPSRMAALAPGLMGLPEGLPVGQVSRPQRQRIGEWLKAIPLTLTATRGLEEAVITRGGVEVREVDPSSMASKKLPGLFLAGELLDVDALTGGFNLQIAFSTGMLAGSGAAAYVRGLS